MFPEVGWFLKSRRFALIYCLWSLLGATIVAVIGGSVYLLRTPLGPAVIASILTTIIVLTAYERVLPSRRPALESSTDLRESSSTLASLQVNVLDFVADAAIDELLELYTHVHSLTGWPFGQLHAFQDAGEGEAVTLSITGSEEILDFITDVLEIARESGDSTDALESRLEDYLKRTSSEKMLSMAATMYDGDYDKHIESEARNLKWRLQLSDLTTTDFILTTHQKRRTQRQPVDLLTRAQRR